MKIGEVQRVSWYRFTDDPHYYSIHKAFYDDGNEIMLRSDESTWPSLVAEANGIGDYKFMRNATPQEIDAWLNAGELVVVDVKEV